MKNASVQWVCINQMGILINWKRETLLKVSMNIVISFDIYVFVNYVVK